MSIFDDITAVLKKARENGNPLDPRICTMRVGTAVLPAVEALNLPTNTPFHGDINLYVGVPIVVDGRLAPLGVKLEWNTAPNKVIQPTPTAENPNPAPL